MKENNIKCSHCGGIMYKCSECENEGNFIIDGKIYCDEHFEAKLGEQIK